MNPFQVCLLFGSILFASALPLAFGASKMQSDERRKRRFGLIFAIITISIVPALLASFYAQKHASYKAEHGTIANLTRRGKGKYLVSVIAIRTSSGSTEEFTTQPLNTAFKVGDEVQIGYLQYTHSRDLRDLNVVSGPEKGWGFHIPDDSSKLLVASVVLILISCLVLTRPVQNLLWDKKESTAALHGAPEPTFDKAR